ncbi:hypothetical protein BD779DRAFT_1515142 [Infundibulicybe gibba]|nr:hypothetical protein BD779DRAFT_1515142 [Infundibulicybe gibba]
MASPCFSADLQAAIENNSLQRRIDSTQTDESPFGSSLTTPVDEVIHPFHDSNLKMLGSGAKYSSYPGRTKEDDTAAPPLFTTMEHPPTTRSRAGSVADKDSVGHPILSASVGPVPLDESQLSLDVDFSVDEAGATPLIRQRANSIYNLPNEPILVEYEAQREHLANDIGNPESEEATSGGAGNLATEQSSISGSIPPVLSITQQYAHLVLRIALFLPWCAAVGGAILLFPDHLELVTFGLQYTTSPKGIHRFAYWADCAVQHIVIFLASIAAIGWASLPLGSLVFGGVLARSMFSWGMFEVDAKIPLGDDDRQSIYLAVAEYVSGDSLTPLKKMDGGYILGDLSDVSDED